MNEEFEFETFDEQPFFFETEEEAESSRRGRMPSGRFVTGRGTLGRRKTFFRRPVIGQRFGPRFPVRFPFRPPVPPPAWPGWFTPTYPVAPEPYPADPSDRPPRRRNRPFGPSGSVSAPEPAAAPIDEPVSGKFDSDAPQNPPDSTSAPDGVGGPPAGVAGAGTEDPSVPSDSADNSSEYYLEFESDAPSSSSSTFIPTPVENPGGGRIKNKRPPDSTDVVNVRGVGQRQIPLHRLAASALQALITAARVDGLADPLLRPVSGFRDPARQARLWQEALARYGSPQEARKWVAPPGGSAHQSGRAIDFYLGGRNSSTNVAQLRNLPAYRWLVANARRFGFYPYEREPWHWEYNPPVAANRELEWNEAFEFAIGIDSKNQPTAAVPGQGMRQAPFGTLTSNAFGRQFSYRFTAEDMLWTARFLVGEAGGRDDLGNRAVIWAMFNRYALFTHRVYPTFHQFIRAYSTPLQPVLRSAGAARRHMNEATFVRTGGNYPGTDVPRGQTQRHLRLQATQWSQLPASARSLAQKALKGQIPNPIGNASEFGSTYVYFHDRHHRYPNAEEWQRYTEGYAKQKKWAWIGPVPGLNQRGNAFFVQGRAANLPADSVKVTPQPESEFESQSYEWTTEVAPSPQAACVETERRATALIERGHELNRRTFARRGAGLNSRIHAAMDVPGPRGALIYAPLDGQVIFSGRKSGYGNIVILLHRQPPTTNAAGPGAVTTAYAHLDQRRVNLGACVTAGQVIGKLGNSTEDARGNRGRVRAGMPLHLHFSVVRVQRDPNRPRYRDRAGFPQSQMIDDRSPAQLGRRFTSDYEEDWTRQVRPDRWLAELGIRITASNASTHQSQPVHVTAQAQRSSPGFEFSRADFGLEAGYDRWQSAMNHSGTSQSGCSCPGG